MWTLRVRVPPRDLFATVAEWLMHRTCNADYVGSIPTGSFDRAADGRLDMHLAYIEDEVGSIPIPPIECSCSLGDRQPPSKWFYVGSIPTRSTDVNIPRRRMLVAQFYSRVAELVRHPAVNGAFRKEYGGSNPSPGA